MDDIYAQQGNDITGAEMVLPPDIPSDIVNFFSGRTVFITGATGFLGRLFLEKLLRTVPNIKRIYIIVRPKDNKSLATRFEEIFEGPSFETLGRKQLNYLSKVTYMAGDCNLPNLGIDEADRETLIKEVECVIHCAATVRFDEQLATAVNINVRATRDLITMAKQMKNLKTFLYVSTAFSFCTRSCIEEIFYESPMDPSKLITLTEILDEEKINQITPTILGPFSNTYTFTKTVAESVVKIEGKKLPIVVFRPSMVIASVKEPVSGWVDNYHTITGIFVGIALGVLRTLYANPDAAAEVVPADYVINCGLAAAWNMATVKSVNDNKEIKTGQLSWEDSFEEDIPVYNFVSSVDARVTWDHVTQLTRKHWLTIPSELEVWHHFFQLRYNKWTHLLAGIFFQTIPAYIVDFIAICLGKPPKMVEAYKKIDAFSKIITYFSVKEFVYSNNHVQTLWKKMNSRDKEMFEFNMKNFDWDGYFYYYLRGARVYLLKDPLETIPKGKIWHRKLTVAHYTLLTVLAAIGINLLLLVFGWLFY